MGNKTKIRTADHTMSFWIGCSRVSEGCKNCYAESFHRFTKWTPDFWTVTRAKTTWRNPAKWQRDAAAMG